MVGTVVDYSNCDCSIHYIKILSGEKICFVYPFNFPEDIRIGMQVEFNISKNICKSLNSKK